MHLNVQPRFPEMCLSLALVTASSPSEYVIPASHFLTAASLTWAPRRRQDITLALDQAIRLWCFAEDLDTLNHAAARFLYLTAGAVRPHIVLPTAGLLSACDY